MESDPNEEEVEDVRLDNEIQRHWRIGFQDNQGRVYDEKSILHTKRWDIYMKNKRLLIKGWYSVYESGFNGNKGLC